MLENNTSLNDDDTSSELYLDAIDQEASAENLISENDKVELQEFKSSVCVWEDIPFQFGVYSQILEARVVLNSNCPKFDRSCRYPERRPPQVKKLEETVLTCHITNRGEKKVCPVCCRIMDHCICGTAFIHSKPSSSSHNKKQICSVCKPPAKCAKLQDPTRSKTKYDNSDIISLLRDIRRIPVPQNIPSKFTTQATTKSGTNDCRIPPKCGCKTLERKYASSPSYLSKLSYFSSEELQLVHSIRGSKLTEALKQKQCIFCDQLLGTCTCGSLKATATPGKCKFCGKPNANCVCSKWKKGFKKEDSLALVSPTRDQLRCICERKPNIAGTIEEIKPDTSKTRHPSPEGTSKGKKDDRQISKTYDKGTKGSENKQSDNKRPITSDSGKLKRPSSKPQIEKPERKPSDGAKKPGESKSTPGSKTPDIKKESEGKPKGNASGDRREPKPTTSSQDKKVENVDKPKQPQKSGDTIKQPDSSKTKVDKKVEDKKSDIPQKPELSKKPGDKKPDISKQGDDKTDDSRKPGTPKQPSSSKTEGTPEDGEKPGKPKKSVCKLKPQSGTELPEEIPPPMTPVKRPPIKDTKGDEKDTGHPTRDTREDEEGMKQPPKEIKEPDKEKTFSPKGPKEDEKLKKRPSKSMKEEDKLTKRPSVPTKEDEKLIKHPPLPTKEDEKLTKRPSEPTKEDDKPTKRPSVPTKEEKPTKRPSMPTKEDEKGTDEIDITPEDETIDEKNQSDRLDLVEPDITITIEISDKDDDFKYSIEEKNEPSTKGDTVRDEIMKIPEPPRTEGKVCQCHPEELPIMVLQKCKPCKTKCKKCSRIPKSTSRILSKSDMPKELAGKKLCHCCNNSTNTEKREVTERGEQYEGDTGGKMLLCKNCRKAKVANTESRAAGTKTKNSQTELSKCKATGCFKRSSTFVCSDKNTSALKTEGCPKTCKRPSTASQIHDRRSRNFESTRKTPGESCAPRPLKSSEETIVQICQPCSEFLPMTSERTCPRQKSSTKQFVSDKLCHCHAKINTDRENLVDKGQQCLKKPSKTFKCKECSQAQTGGTFEQDMIASYVASCSTNPESPPPQQFIIQTLLYQFAGYELDKDPNPPRRRRSLDRSRSPQLKPGENVMRSIQVQVGPSSPPKCEAAQTVTTFILTDPRTVLKTETSPGAEGKINYVCGPDVPGIRTKLAMNLNQMPAIDEDDSCVCAPICVNEPTESLDQCESSVCPYYQDGNAADNSRPNFKVLKKDKYVFITVTPVQTEPYEPNYYIIFSTSEENTNKKEPNGKKTPQKGSKPNQERTPKKDPLDRFKNQIFSRETLKSKEFLDFFETKQEAIQNAKVIGPSCDPKNPVCIAALLEKAKNQLAEPAKKEDDQTEVEDKGCGPDTCEYLKANTKDQPAECCFGHEELTTRTVACGSDHCLHQTELNEFKLKKVPASTEPCKTQGRRAKDVECGPDTCSFKKQKERATNDKICISIQTEEFKQKRTTSKKPSKAIVVTITCDAATSTDLPKQEKVKSDSLVCDKEMCTNECEKGDAASQACLDKDEKLSKKKVGTTTVIHKYCDASCSPAGEEFEEEPSEDISCDSSLEPNVADQQESEAEPSKIKECDDKVCPEKTTKSAEKLRDEVPQATDEPVKDDECQDSVCPKKKVNTKLDDHDVFALELAMNRFIRVNPKSINED